MAGPAFSIHLIFGVAICIFSGSSRLSAEACIADESSDGSSPARLVVVFGDSIAAGTALPEADRKHAWVQVVESRSDGLLKMVNEGKGGRPTDSVSEFKAMLKRQPVADVLVLTLGTNHSRDITDGCVPKAVSHIRQMIDLARSQYGESLQIVIVGPPNIRKDSLVATRPIANERETKLKELGDGFAKLAKDADAEFVSLFGVVPEQSLTRDGVHPDVAGNAAIAQKMLEILNPARQIPVPDECCSEFNTMPTTQIDRHQDRPRSIVRRVFAVERSVTTMS